MNLRLALVVAAASTMVPAAALAHFVLHSPKPTLEQNRLGDPQKSAPCGGTSTNPGKATAAVTEVKGGEMLHLKVEETIYHPGHYRVAMAVNELTELPPEPETVTRDTPRGPWSVSAKIDPNPKAPVLADGLFVHTTAPEKGSFFETDVRMPNINCDRCVVQVIQWMAEHAYNYDGGYSYHHCATVKITADPRKPIDKAWPKQR